MVDVDPKGSLRLVAASCDGPKVVVAANTLCTLTDRYHTTADQKAVYTAQRVIVLKDNGERLDVGSGEAAFGSLVRWFLGFN